jgi:acetylornithine/succinyldiaminopimelate/putrescine aminotransferase
MDLMDVLSTRPDAHLGEVYAQLPFEPVRGEGVYLYDRDGRRVLDLYGGHAVALLGYGHAPLTAAIARQAKDMVFQSNAVPLRVRDEAAERLVEFAGAGLERVFFVNSGAEANENALRIALRATGRTKVVALEHGFHGRTAAAAAVSYGSSKGWYGFPRLPFDIVFVARDDPAAITAAVDESTAAVIIEPVQGLAGAYDLSREYLAAAASACERSGALLILDEVQTGMGRLGAPFGANLFGIAPDLLTTAKGLAGGLPAGAVLMRADIARDFKVGMLGTTFGGGPIACAAMCVVIDTIRRDKLLARVRDVSAYIRESCAVGTVTGFQGAGFLLGLRTRAPAAKVRDALLARGILAGTSSDPTVLRLLPPLVLERRHVEELVNALGEIHATLQ